MQSTIGLGLIEILLFLFGNGGLLGMPPGERDVAFFSYTFSEAIGWKPESSSRNSA